jgi:hypothetical protein
MAQSGGRMQLGIEVGIESDALAEDLADATLQLRRELLELDVDAVELARAGPPPPGSKAVDFVAVGMLVVTVARTGLFTGVVTAIHSWLGSHPGGSIKLELDGDVLELTGVSSKEQRRLADEWLRRHDNR